MSLSSELREFFHTCKRHAHNTSAPAVHCRTAGVQRALWKELRDNAWQLVCSFSSQHGARVSWMSPLKEALDVAVQVANWMLANVATTSSCEGSHNKQGDTLRLGLANPGVQGCSDFAGSQVRWDPLLHQQWGLCGAVRSLCLDAVGLTAPRLPDHVPAPQRLGMHMSCKGGQSYASTAVLRSADFMFISAVRSDLGSNRRMWVDVQLKNGETLHWVVLTMPTSASDRDEEWLAEIEGLQEDIVALSATSRLPNKHLILGTGDMNFQPDELGGGREPLRKRQLAWERMCRSHDFVLHNPPLAEQSVCSLSLPFRNKEVRIREASTRHGIGVGRAIDLVFSSPQLVVDVVIHNGLHCSSSCPLQHCQETCRGDHFLMEIKVDAAPSWSSGPAAPAFPGKWHDKDKWAEALQPAEKVLQRLGELAIAAGDELCLLQQHLSARRVNHIWGIEATSVLSSIIGGLTRDIWLKAGPGGALRQSINYANLFESTLFDLPDDAKTIVNSLCKESDKAAVLNSCFRLLRDPAPQPVPKLSKGNTILSEADSNAEWASALREQCSWPEPFDQHLHDLTLQRSRQLCAGAVYKPKPLSQDHPVTEREVVDIKNNWSASRGMPPDLLPRALFMAGSPGWDRVVWAIQRWAGPGGAAYRPSLWRKATLCPVHKAGPANCAASFRLIFVKAQLGLMQEALLTQRWLNTVRKFIQPCQSGYIRGTEDAHLLLHEICAEAKLQQRPLWLVMGDFQKAFPRVCRDDLLCALADGPHVNGQCLGLFADILHSDRVTIWHSGYSETVIMSGIPEGGSLGPFGYPVLLDTLVREILADGGGLGVGWRIPVAWQGRVWSGTGTSNPSLVAMLKNILNSSNPDAWLPSSELLAVQPDLEASALQAMNDVAPWKLAAILHADDPVLLGCSREAVQRGLNKLACWAYRHKAAFHVTQKKTVSMVTPSVSGSSGALPLHPLVLPGRGGTPDRHLQFTQNHKWLGVLWPANLVFDTALQARVALAKKSFALLVGLAQRDVLPIDMAVAVFRAKVLPVLHLGSWLYGLADSAASTLDDLLVTWAKQLLGACCWHNSALVLSELGWDISGFNQVLLAMAMRRARLWTLPSEDLYAKVFRVAALWPDSWSARSAALLRRHGVLDYPTWGGFGSNLQNYRSYVLQRCSWLGILAKTGCSACPASSLLGISSTAKPVTSAGIKPGPLMDRSTICSIVLQTASWRHPANSSPG